MSEQPEKSNGPMFWVAFIIVFGIVFALGFLR